MAERHSQAPAAEPIAESAKSEESVDRLLDKVASPSGLTAGGGALRAARVLSISGGVALVAWRGNDAGSAALLGPGVEAELIAEIAEQRGMVLVEEGPPALVVGALQTRRPRELKLSGRSVVLEGEQEVVIRAGRAAIRLREDGDVEIVGGRIHLASRGLFRLVGRILRLN